VSTHSAARLSPFAALHKISALTLTFQLCFNHHHHHHHQWQYDILSIRVGKINSVVQRWDELGWDTMLVATDLSRSTSHPGQLSLVIPPWVRAMSKSTFLVWSLFCFLFSINFNSIFENNRDLDFNVDFLCDKCL